MKQILIINGGNSFNTYEEYRSYLDEKTLSYEKLLYHEGWKGWLAHQMPDTEILVPQMPNPLNAVYDEWSIYFEKILQFIGDDCQIVGHSLGANFLARYLNYNPLPIRAKQLILLAGGYDDESNESLGSFKVTSAKNLPQSADEIHLFHSEDDPVVPYIELAKYQADLPTAITHAFTDRGHFYNITPTFPEMLELLQQK